MKGWLLSDPKGISIYISKMESIHVNISFYTHMYMCIDDRFVLFGSQKRIMTKISFSYNIAFLLILVLVCMGSRKGRVIPTSILCSGINSDDAWRTICGVGSNLSWLHVK